MKNPYASSERDVPFMKGGQRLCVGCGDYVVGPTSSNDPCVMYQGQGRNSIISRLRSRGVAAGIINIVLNHYGYETLGDTDVMLIDIEVGDYGQSV